MAHVSLSSAQLFSAESALVTLDSTYLIRTLVASVSDPGQEVQPLAYRVYATRQQGRSRV